MKKFLIILAIILGALVMFYGAVSAMVNQGNSLVGSIATFFLVIAGAIILIKALKPDSGTLPK